MATFQEMLAQMGLHFQCGGGGDPYQSMDVNSPHIPLLGFETTGGTRDDPEYTKAVNVKGHYLSAEVRNIRDIANGSYKPGYVDSKIATATLKAISAYGRSPACASKTAREALAIHPWCPEAYNVLATHEATSLEEALEYYQTGIRFGQMILSEENYDRAIGEAFLVPPLRPLLRCINGAAIVLLKLGRYEESYYKYEKLKRLDPNLRMLQTYTNFRYHIPLLYLRWKGVGFAKSYMHAQSTNYDTASTGLAWGWTQALMDYKEHGANYFPWRYFGEFDGASDSAAIIKMCKSQCAILVALQNGPSVLQFLAGECALPRGPLPVTFGVRDEMVMSVVYLHAAGDLWKNEPGAIEWALKCRNMLEAMLMMRQSVPQKPYSFARVKALLSKGAIKSSGTDQYDSDMIFDAVCCEKTSGELICLVIEEVGCSPDAVRKGLTPLGMALYYDVDPGVIKALIRNGARVGRPSINEQGPLGLAVNQGNHRALRATLEEVPAIASDAKELRCLFLGLLTTSVLECMQRFGAKCQRCLVGTERPHSRHASFEQCVDVLAEFGLRIDAGLECAAGRDRLKGALIAQLKRQGKVLDAKKHPEGEILMDGETGFGRDDTKADGNMRKDGASSETREKKKRKKKALAFAGCYCCGKTDVKIMKCSLCRSVGYCSLDCQKTDWNKHKAPCKLMGSKGDCN